METFEIKSNQNNLVKYAVKLQSAKFRKTEKKILIDGEKSVEGIINDKIEFEYLFLKSDNPLAKKAKTKNLVFVNDEILKKISTTKSPSSVAGIINEPVVKKDVFFDMKKIVLIDGIKDAGNLGTIIRSASAFSMDGLILFNDCVDLYNTKTIRAAAQNIFKIPVFQTGDIDFILKLKKTHKLISTVVNSDNDFMNYKFNDKFILSFGSEADGISDDILNITDETLTFKMDNDVESLNLAICASVAFAMIKNNRV